MLQVSMFSSFSAIFSLRNEAIIQSSEMAFGVSRTSEQACDMHKAKPGVKSGFDKTSTH